MATLQSQQLNLTEEYCIELGVLSATSTYYRVSLLFALTISTISAAAMIYFLARYYGSSLLFHSNLKMLYFFLSLSCLTFDVFNIIAKVHHLTASFLFESPCEIMMSKAFLIATSFPLFFSIGTAQFALMSMIVERWIAIIFVRNYESGYKKLGPALTAISVLINCCSMYIMYYGETFDIPQWNARLMPSTTYPRSSAVLLTFLIMNFISLLVTITLYAFSRKQRRTLTLSSKFQSNENIIALNLLFMITSVQFFTAFFAQMCGLYLRTYQFKNPLRFAYRENFDLFNYYTLLLPILSTFYFVKVKRRRIKDITNKINMKATGSDGWTNYSNMIQNQWK
ncbi:hypothetical protein V3C99_007650 [Haemonchus contortus]